MFEKLKNIILQINKEPRAIIKFLLLFFSKYLEDRFYLSLLFKLTTGKKLNLDNPKSFNEKLQWLKLYDRRPEYTTYVDKYAVREYIAKTIGEEYLIPLLGVWNSPDEIDFDKLPNQFVLKCNHDSQSICVCKNKTEFDNLNAKEKLRKCLKRDYYLSSREWPYKDVSRKIIAEKLMVDDSGYELKDYKIFCFNGKAKAMFIATDRMNKNEETKFDFFDMNFNHLDFTHGHPNAKVFPKKPKNFELMKHLAEKLSKGIPQIRIDFYEINGKVYFGEMTLFHHAGLVLFKPEKWDYIFGSWIDLPENKHCN